MADRSPDRDERRTAAHPVGPDGIVIGAGAIERPTDGPRGALLIHGFGDTPQTLHYLAEDLHAHGWGVRVPLLPGHGRPLDAFAHSLAEDWIRAVRDALADMRQQYASMALVGLSMGGALGSLVASDNNHVLSSLTLIAPYLGMPWSLRRVAAWHQVLSLVYPVARGGGGERSILDPEEREKNLATGATTPGLVAELRRVVRLADAALPNVTVPTMIIQSRADNRIAPEITMRAFARLGAKDKKLVWTEQGGHVITVDYGRERVIREVREWMGSH